MIIRATEEHLDALVDLFDAYRVWYGKASDKVQAASFLQARMKAAESVIFLKIDDVGVCVGFTQLYPLFSSTRMGRLWLLNDLFVREMDRGKGYSKELIEAGKRLAKSTNAVGLMLETEKSNTIGNNLYPAVGFSMDTMFNVYHWSNDGWGVSG